MDECLNGVCGRGCDEAESSEEKRLFTERGQGIEVSDEVVDKELCSKGDSLKMLTPFIREKLKGNN